MGGHVLQPAGLPDEAKCSLLGAQAPLLAVQGGHVPEDVGAAPPGDHLGGGSQAAVQRCPPAPLSPQTPGGGGRGRGRSLTHGGK